MSGWEKIRRLIPPPLRESLDRLTSEQQCRAQELRLRRGGPVSLVIGGKRQYVSSFGLCSAYEQAVICLPEWFDRTVDYACGHSLYAHQEELRRGYLTTSEGIRIGIAGSAVVQQGKITGFRELSSLCFRIPHQHPGIAAGLFRLLTTNGLHSALICGEPSCGKTSLLRELMHELSRAGIAVSVVDERGELTGDGQSIEADVLLRAPKAEGILCAVRSLAPQIILLDELGDQADVLAVMDGMNRGVPTVATVHCRDPMELLRHPAFRTALLNGTFECLIVLQGREMPGRIRSWYRTEEWLHEMAGRGFIDSDRNRYRTLGEIPLTEASTSTAENDCVYQSSFRQDSLYGCSG